MEREQLNNLLLQVLEQARSLSIPVSDQIDPQVTVNTRAKTRFGCCRSRNGRHIIEVAAVMMEAEEFAVRRVLAHEVLHTCPGCANHGKRWQHWAKLMSQRFGYDIRRTDNYAALGVADTRSVRYLVVCSSCGRQTPRMKRSALVTHPQSYRCKCGGSLYVIENNNNGKVAGI